MDKPKVIDIKLCTIIVPVVEHEFRIQVGRTIGNDDALGKMREACPSHDAQSRLSVFSVKMDGGSCASTATALMKCALNSLGKAWDDVVCPSEAQVSILIDGMFGYERNVQRVVPVRMKKDVALVSFSNATFFDPKGYQVIRFHDKGDQGVFNDMILMVPFAVS